MLKLPNRLEARIRLLFTSHRENMKFIFYLYLIYMRWSETILSLLPLYNSNCSTTFTWAHWFTDAKGKNGHLKNNMFSRECDMLHIYYLEILLYIIRATQKSNKLLWITWNDRQTQKKKIRQQRDRER